MTDSMTLDWFLWQKGLLCSSCLKKLEIAESFIRLKNGKAFLIYEENEAFQTLWDQYQILHDQALDQLFLSAAPATFKRMQKMDVILCQDPALLSICRKMNLPAIPVEQIQHVKQIKGKKGLFVLEPKEANDLMVLCTRQEIEVHTCFVLMSKAKSKTKRKGKRHKSENHM